MEDNWKIKKSKEPNVINYDTLRRLEVYKEALDNKIVHLPAIEQYTKKRLLKESKKMVLLIANIKNQLSELDRYEYQNSIF